MRLSGLMTDEAVLQELGRRITALRLQANLTQKDLAESAGVSKRTLERAEAGESSVQLTAFLRIVRALGALDRLEQFLPEVGPTPMELLKRKRRPRQRASRAGGLADSRPWTWGDKA